MSPRQLVEVGDELALLLHGAGLTSAERVRVERVAGKLFWVEGLENPFNRGNWKYQGDTMPGWSYELRLLSDPEAIQLIAEQEKSEIWR